MHRAQVATMPHREFGRLWCSYVSAMAACLLDIRTRGCQDAARRLVSSAAPALGHSMLRQPSRLQTPPHCWRCLSPVCMLGFVGSPRLSGQAPSRARCTERAVCRGRTFGAIAAGQPVTQPPGPVSYWHGGPRLKTNPRPSNSAGAPGGGGAAAGAVRAAADA